MILNPYTILVVLALLFAILSFFVPQYLLQVAVILLAVAMLIGLHINKIP